MKRSTATVLLSGLWFSSGYLPLVPRWDCAGQWRSPHTGRGGVKGDRLEVTCWVWPHINTHLIYHSSVSLGFSSIVLSLFLCFCFVVSASLSVLPLIIHWFSLSCFRFVMCLCFCNTGVMYKFFLVCFSPPSCPYLHLPESILTDIDYTWHCRQLLELLELILASQTDRTGLLYRSEFWRLQLRTFTSLNHIDTFYIKYSPQIHNVNIF